MEFTTLTIIIMCVLLFLGIVTPLINPFLRLPRKQEDQAEEGIEETADSESQSDDEATEVIEKQTVADAKPSKAMPVSAVILAHDNAPQLKNSLELFLNQNYSADYEVIVVADKSDSETDDVVKLYSDNKRLYATFMPKSSRYLSRRKLGITLGIKAAHYDWVIVTNGYCRPSDKNWLAAFASQLTDDKEVVLGHTYFDHHAPSYYQFDHLRYSLYELKSADNGSPVAIIPPLLAIKKTLFITNDGYRGNLKFVRGEFAFLVNKYANSENTVLSISPNAWLIEETPYKRRWKNKHLYHLNINPHLERNSWKKVLYQIDMWSMHTCNLAIIAAIVYGVIFQNWLVCIAAGVSFIIEYILRAIIAHRALKRFQLDINCAIVPIYEFCLTFGNWIWRLRYAFADKNDFITHKL